MCCMFQREYPEKDKKSAGSCWSLSQEINWSTGEVIRREANVLWGYLLRLFGSEMKLFKTGGAVQLQIPLGQITICEPCGISFFKVGHVAKQNKNAKINDRRKTTTARERKTLPMNAGRQATTTKARERGQETGKVCRKHCCLPFYGSVLVVLEARDLGAGFNVNASPSIAKILWSGIRLR